MDTLKEEALEQLREANENVQKAIKTTKEKEAIISKMTEENEIELQLRDKNINDLTETLQQRDQQIKELTDKQTQLEEEIESLQRPPTKTVEAQTELEVVKIVERLEIQNKELLDLQLDLKKEDIYATLLLEILTLQVISNNFFRPI